MESGRKYRRKADVGMISEVVIGTEYRKRSQRISGGGLIFCKIFGLLFGLICCKVENS